MIQIKSFIFNDFQENTYVLSDGSGDCIIIDPGCSSPSEFKRMNEWIVSKSLKPVRLVNTHAHIDHILGWKYVKESYNLVPEAHEEEAVFVAGAKEHAAMFGLDIEQPPSIGRFLSEKENLEFGNSALEIIHVPGHSPGGLVFFSRQQKFMIAGDALFHGSIGRTDLPGGDHDTLIRALKEKILVLDHDVEVYPGHGPATSIGVERMSNPFLT